MMISQEWDKVRAKFDALSMRERAMVFGAAAFLIYTLINMLLLEPVLLQKKKLAAQVREQNEAIATMQIQIDAYQQAKNALGDSPLRERIKLLKEQLLEGDALLQNNREKLVHPEKMAELLRQVLGKNGNLQLVALRTLPAEAVLDRDQPAAEAGAAKPAVVEKHIYKHGVEMTVRGSYMDLLQYLTTLERLPTQMFWGNVKMEVVKYPASELTVRLYTLSLDKVWLQV